MLVVTAAPETADNNGVRAVVAVGAARGVVPATAESFRRCLGPLDDSEVWDRCTEALGSPSWLHRGLWRPLRCTREDLRGAPHDRRHRWETWDLMWRTAPSHGRRTLRELSPHLWPAAPRPLPRVWRLHVWRMAAHLLQAPATTPGGGPPLVLLSPDEVLPIRQAAHFVSGFVGLEAGVAALEGPLPQALLVRGELSGGSDEALGGVQTSPCRPSTSADSPSPASCPTWPSGTSSAPSPSRG